MQTATLAGLWNKRRTKRCSTIAEQDQHGEEGVPRIEQPQLRPKEVPAGTPPIIEQHRDRSRASPSQQQKAAAPNKLEPAERSPPAAIHQPPSRPGRARGNKTRAKATKMTASHTLGCNSTRWPQTSSATLVMTASHALGCSSTRWPQTSSSTQVSPYPHLRVTA